MKTEEEGGWDLGQLILANRMNKRDIAWESRALRDAVTSFEARMCDI